MDSNLQAMQLYNNENFTRIQSAVDRVAGQKEGELQIEDLGGVDIMHYTHDFKELEDIFQNGSDISTVLDIGAGPGSADRYLAKKYGVKITCLEFQEELCRLNTYINETYTKSGAQFPSLVRVLHGDFLTYGPEAKFDLVFTQLCLLHIPDKEKVFQQLGRCTGKYFYIEDYYLKDDTSLDTEDKTTLAENIEVPGGDILTEEQMNSFFIQNGLEVVSFTDKTDEWARFTWTRCEKFIGNKESFISSSSEACYTSLLQFYLSVAQVFRCVNHEAFPNTKAAVNDAFIQKPQVLRGVIIFGKVSSPN